MCSHCFSVCKLVTVSGTLFQTALEGQYALIHHSCDGDNRLLYRQTHMPEGWANRFYLYYKTDEEDVGFWMFGEQRCSQLYSYFLQHIARCLQA